MKKIRDFSPSEEVHGLVVRLSNVQIRKTTTNADYASMLAYDGEETIEAKIWAFNEEIREKLDSGEVYAASGRMKDYQGKMQFTITDIRLITEEDDIDLSLFYETAKIDYRELQTLIEKYVKKITNPILKDLTIGLLKKHYVNYFSFPAAVNMHHNYNSGLAYHTYSMLKLSDTFLELYPFLNSSLVYAGILLHDIGKLIELSGAKGTEYTKKGKLLGHLVISSNEVHLMATELGVEESEEILALQHVLLAHHGQLEFGSPKEPMIPEAALVHFLDLTDSKMAALEKEASKTPPGEFTQPILSFDRRVFYIPKMNDKR